MLPIQKLIMARVSDWWEAEVVEKGESRCSMKESGGLCVEGVSGGPGRPRQSARNWDFLTTVSLSQSCTQIF